MFQHTYLSRALAYFSKSLFAMSASWDEVDQCSMRERRPYAYLDLYQLVAVPPINILELVQVILHGLQMKSQGAQFAINVSTLRIYS